MSTHTDTTPIILSQTHAGQHSTYSAEWRRDEKRVYLWETGADGGRVEKSWRARTISEAEARIEKQGLRLG